MKIPLLPLVTIGWVGARDGITFVEGAVTTVVGQLEREGDASWDVWPLSSELEKPPVLEHYQQNLSLKDTH